MQGLIGKSLFNDYIVISVMRESSSRSFSAFWWRWRGSSGCTCCTAPTLQFKGHNYRCLYGEPGAVHRPAQRRTSQGRGQEDQLSRAMGDGSDHPWLSTGQHSFEVGVGVEHPHSSGRLAHVSSKKESSPQFRWCMRHLQHAAASPSPLAVIAVKSDILHKYECGRRLETCN